MTMTKARPTMRRFTPTERRILAYLAEREGRPCSKREMAEALGRSQKTIDRLVSQLRAEGLLVSQPRWGENGSQLSNVYRLGREVEA